LSQLDGQACRGSCGHRARGDPCADSVRAAWPTLIDAGRQVIVGSSPLGLRRTGGRPVPCRTVDGPGAASLTPGGQARSGSRPTEAPAGPRRRRRTLRPPTALRGLSAVTSAVARILQTGYPSGARSRSRSRPRPRARFAQLRDPFGTGSRVLSSIRCPFEGQGPDRSVGADPGPSRADREAAGSSPASPTLDMTP
jgi:hypothetical protein